VIKDMKNKRIIPLGLLILIAGFVAVLTGIAETQLERILLSAINSGIGITVGYALFAK